MKGRISVTASTISGCAFEGIIFVTFFAGHADVRTSQLEDRKIMVKTGRIPGLSFMAGAALLAKFTLMLIIFFVTGKTCSWCALIDIADMASNAFRLYMFPIQLES